MGRKARNAQLVRTRENPGVEKIIALSEEERPKWITNYTRQYTSPYKDYVIKLGTIGEGFVFGEGFNDGYKVEEQLKPLKVQIGLNTEPINSYYRAYIKQNKLESRGWFYELGWNLGYKVCKDKEK